MHTTARFLDNTTLGTMGWPTHISEAQAAPTPTTVLDLYSKPSLIQSCYFLS